jgi:hypothetical protein
LIARGSALSRCRKIVNGKLGLERAPAKLRTYLETQEGNLQEIRELQPIVSGFPAVISGTGSGTHISLACFSQVTLNYGEFRV